MDFQLVVLTEYVIQGKENKFGPQTPITIENKVCVD
jgi:hypothetical protein